YRHLIRWGLKFRKTVLLIALLSLVGALALFPRVGVEFMPATDNGIFTVTVETPAGSSKEYTQSKLLQAELIVRQYPEVERAYSTIAGGMAATGSNVGTMTVTLVSQEERDVSVNEFMPQLRRSLQAVPGATFEVAVASMMGAGTAPVSVTLYGDSFEVLENLADGLMADMAKIDGLIDISSSLDEAQPVVGIQVNREVADSLGVSLGQIAATLSPLISGEDVSDWVAPNGQVYKVVVRLPETLRNDIEAIGNLPIAQTGTGTQDMITLGQVAEVVESNGPATINRQDLQRGVTISANLEGVELGTVIPQLQEAIGRIDFPVGYRSGFGGEAEQIADTM